MTRAWILLAVLAACTTSPEKADIKKAKPATKTLRTAELKVDRVSRTPDPLGLALSVRYDKANPPERLSKDFQQGHGWLRIEKPRGFSFAIHDLLRREQVFVPSAASITSGRAGSPLSCGWKGPSTPTTSPVTSRSCPTPGSRSGDSDRSTTRTSACCSGVASTC
jgi:hypothetical protein